MPELRSEACRTPTPPHIHVHIHIQWIHDQTEQTDHSILWERERVQRNRSRRNGCALAERNRHSLSLWNILPPPPPLPPPALTGKPVTVFRLNADPSLSFSSLFCFLSLYILTELCHSLVLWTQHCLLLLPACFLLRYILVWFPW